MKKKDFNSSLLFALILLAFALYGFLLWLLVLGTRLSVTAEIGLKDYFFRFSNLIPFLTIFRDIKSIITGMPDSFFAFSNLLGNPVMLVPLGIFLPFFFKCQQNKTVLGLTVFLLILTIECSQILTRKGFFDVDDFILGMTGAFFGFHLWHTATIQKIRFRTEQ